MPPSLTDVFLAGLPEQLRTVWRSVDVLEAKLEALVSASQAQWPDLRLEPHEFLGHIAARFSDSEPPAPDFPHLNGPDLYLAAACVHGDPAALSAFEKHYLQQVPSMLASMKPSPDLIEEVQQQLRCRLLTASPGEQPKLAGYKGRGALLMWVRAAAVRTALNVLDRAENRKRTELPENDSIWSPQAAGASSPAPERALLIDRYRDTVREAFLAALSELPPQQRTLLRLHYLDGRTLEEIGLIYRVHKATISRRLEAARGAVLGGIQKKMQERLKLTKSEVDSLVQAVSSQLEVSIAQALRSSAPK